MLKIIEDKRFAYLLSDFLNRNLNLSYLHCLNTFFNEKITTNLKIGKQL